ncbi:hypothetical protein BpHYR1_005563 [Brachionus plicatilis]|uniref:Uncharacterized protein n=1 Tax=Brachionus plicatilis TaxID=10195 RepID=A0A3M7T6E8_BRAPC|nr:hypothetical protein BpHYR1_005563 [Brachionus plicatilis]
MCLLKSNADYIGTISDNYLGRKFQLQYIKINLFHCLEYKSEGLSCFVRCNADTELVKMLSSISSTDHYDRKTLLYEFVRCIDCLMLCLICVIIITPPPADPVRLEPCWISLYFF